MANRGRERAAGLAIAVFLAGCDRPPPPVSPRPANAGPETVGPQQEAPAEAVSLRYSTQANVLSAATTFEVASAGGGTMLQLSLTQETRQVIEPVGDRLKLGWNIEGVQGLDLGGTVEADQASTKAFVETFGEGAMLIDRLGTVDEAASNGLPENKPLKQELERIHAELQARVEAGESVQFPLGPNVLVNLEPALRLPVLPQIELPVGIEQTTKRTESRNFPGVGIVVPMTTEIRYVLTKIDDSSGSRIAEVDIQGTTIGHATDSGRTFDLESRYEARLLFDLDVGLPAAYELSQVESWEMGELDGDLAVEFRTTWH